MIYGTGITTAAGGSKATATRTILRLTKGLIWLMEVDFPPGCVGLVHVQIFDGNYQLLPASPDKDLSGDGRLLRYDDLYLKEAAPFEVSIVTWNEDELWSTPLGPVMSYMYVVIVFPATNLFNRFMLLCWMLM